MSTAVWHLKPREQVLAITEAQPSLQPPSGVEGPARSSAPVSFWYNAIDPAALSAASTGEVESQVRSTTEAEGVKAPITSAHLPMQVPTSSLPRLANR
jgi:hypothetical protein